MKSSINSKVLHTYLTGIVLIVIIMATFVVVFTILELNQASIVESLLTKQANLQLIDTHVIALAISSQLEDVETKIGDSAADLSNVKNLQSEQTHSILENTFQNVEQDFPDTILYLVDKNDIIIDGVNYNNLTFNGKSLAYREDIKTVHSTLKEQVSNGFYGVDGKFRIAVSYPVFDTDKNLIGIIGASTPADLYFSKLTNASSTQSQFSAILDKNQTYLSTPRKFQIGDSYFSDKIQSYFGRNTIQNKQYGTVFSGTPSSAIYNFGGERINTGYPVYVNDEIQYFVFVITPTDSIYAEPNAIYYSQIIELGIIFTITIFIMIFFIRKNFNLVKKLEEVNKNLLLADKAKDEFAAMLTHELRTPLVPIQGYVDILLSGHIGSLTDVQKEKLQIIKDSTRSLLNLISDILDVQKLELGQLKIVKQRNNIKDTVTQSVEALKTVASGKTIVLVNHINSNIFASYDDERIKQVITNLIKNSLNVCSPQTGKVEIIANDSPSEIKISVKDNGKGIPDADKDKIFRKFYQADTSSTRESGGTGVGLAICKGIVETHGGKIWFESKYGQGTTFIFTIPK
ncbi:MAG: sensor histidine kinase [Nitrosotalea sp.]